MEFRRTLAPLLALFLAACGNPDAPPPAEARVLHLYNWSDYIDEATLPAFEQATGIKVRYDVFDSNELLEAKLLAGHTGYDLVVPSASFVARQIEAGVFQPLDPARTPNRRHLDPALMEILADYDPGNRHALPWLWGTTGLGYNRAMIASRMPDAPVDSWRLVFDPTVVAHFADCGVAMLDTPSEIYPLVLRYLGLPTDSEDAADMARVEAVLTAIRPHVRYFHSSQYINDLANGELCLVIGWSGDVLIARDRASEAKNGHAIAYSIPREGSLVWIDAIAMPRDAPHPDNAYRFLDFVMQPEIAAAISNHVNYANANPASTPLLDPVLRDDRGIYPDADTRAKLFPNAVHSASWDRLASRAWMRIKSGR